MNENELENYSSPLREASVQLHELFTELRDSGFSRKEALHLVTAVLTKTIFSEGDVS